MSCFI